MAYRPVLMVQASYRQHKDSTEALLWRYVDLIMVQGTIGPVIVGSTGKMEDVHEI